MPAVEDGGSPASRRLRRGSGGSDSVVGCLDTQHLPPLCYGVCRRRLLQRAVGQVGADTTRRPSLPRCSPNVVAADAAAPLPLTHCNMAPLADEALRASSQWGFR